MIHLNCHLILFGGCLRYILETLQAVSLSRVIISCLCVCLDLTALEVMEPLRMSSHLQVSSSESVAFCAHLQTANTAS